MKKHRKFWYDDLAKSFFNGHKNRKNELNLIQLLSGENMQIAVCDDEKVFLDLFSGYIKNCMATCEEYNNEVTIDAYSSGELLLEAYNQGQTYDIIFLDIRMDGLNGFDTAKMIRELDSRTMIVFITSLSDYIFNSFEYRPFWFLIKPVSEEKFRYVFFKALTELKHIRTREFSFFTREHGLLSLEISKICYLESVLRRIIIQTTMEQYTYYANISSEEEKLIKYDFVRIHKGYLVNMAYIQRINKNNVVLKNSVVLPLSEHRYKAVFDSFTSYLARCSV